MKALTCLVLAATFGLTSCTIQVPAALLSGGWVYRLSPNLGPEQNKPAPVPIPPASDGSGKGEGVAPPPPVPPSPPPKDEVPQTTFTQVWGVVKDSQDTPVEGACVLARINHAGLTTAGLDGNGLFANGSDTSQAITNQIGAYSIDGVPVGARILLDVTKDGYDPRRGLTDPVTVRGLASDANRFDFSNAAGRPLTKQQENPSQTCPDITQQATLLAAIRAWKQADADQKSAEQYAQIQSRYTCTNVSNLDCVTNIARIRVAVQAAVDARSEATRKRTTMANEIQDSYQRWPKQCVDDVLKKYGLEFYIR